MARFRGAIEGLLDREGGLVELPHDPGGLTNFGISLAAHRELGFEGIRNLTRQQAGTIYLREYWSPLRLPEIKSLAVAIAIFDFGVHSGRRRATITAQRIAGVADDGRFGPVTIAAVNRVDPRFFVARYNLDRVLFWQICARRVGSSTRRYLRSFLNRLAKLEAELRSIPFES